MKRMALDHEGQGLSARVRIFWSSNRVVDVWPIAEVLRAFAANSVGDGGEPDRAREALG
jgi:hypothetical protein